MSKKIVDLPEGYKPSHDEKYMNPNQLEYFRRKLISWREELVEQSNQTMENLKQDNHKDPDIFDQADADRERNFELRTRDRYRKLLNKINEALEMIENGEYGYCVETGEEIGIDRLEARPIAMLTIEAQEKHENYERQHSDQE